MMTAEITTRGVEVGGRLISISAPRRNMTHVVLWERPDGGYLIGRYAATLEGAEREKVRLDRRVRNPMSPGHVVAKLAR